MSRIILNVTYYTVTRIATAVLHTPREPLGSPTGVEKVANHLITKAVESLDVVVARTGKHDSVLHFKFLLQTFGKVYVEFFELRYALVVDRSVNH